MDAIFNVDKPRGITSYNAVARIKRLSQERRVGHAGTLDPDASGVLPVCLGKATRVIEYLIDATKAYIATIELGTTTDTYDSSGRITSTCSPSQVTREQVENALNPFLGQIQQLPPMYSAVKHRGTPLYHLARRGMEVERQKRGVFIHSLRLTDWSPPVLTLEVECSKGTYIRSLAHDLGQELGCGAMLKGLVRTRCGPFCIDSSVPLSRLEEALREGSAGHYAHPPDLVLRHWKAVTLDGEQEKAVTDGKTLLLDTPPAEGEMFRRAYNRDGEFIAVLQFAPGEGGWHPKKVFARKHT